MYDKIPYKSTGAIVCDPENDIYLDIIQQNKQNSKIDSYPK